MSRRTIAACTLLLAVAAAAPLSGQARRYIDGRSASDASAAPYSGAVQIGNTLYLSGTIGLDANGGVPATTEEEARNVLNNIKGTLQSAGMTMDDLVSVQVFCSDLGYYDAFNAVYKTFFTREYPARAFLGAGSVLRGARFEVMAIAVKR